MGTPPESPLRIAIIEETQYTEAVKRLGGARTIDHALETIVEHLYLNAEAFPLIKGYEPLRLARTRGFVWKKQRVPPLRLWYYISGERCYFWHIEEDG